MRKTEAVFNASGIIFSNAKFLRKKMTYAEQLLWSRIRKNQLGFYFRRQHPFGAFILDFYCHSVKLVIEVDGGYHNNKIVQQEDQCKEESLKAVGIEIIRFSNDQIISNLDEVVEGIKIELKLLALRNNHEEED